MDDRHAFLGIAPTDGGCSVAVLFPKFTSGSYRVRLAGLHRFDAREEHRELFEYVFRELRDPRTPLGSAPRVRLVADVSGGVPGQLLLDPLRRLQGERFPVLFEPAAVLLVQTGEVISRPAGYGFPKVPRPLALAALVRVASGGRLDLEQKGKLTREFLAQLEAARQKRARDEEETFDLVDAVSLAAYNLARAAAPVVARMEEERRRKLT